MSQRLFGVFLVAISLCLPISGVQASDSRPHIILILADDLGWGDVGYHGSQIATPSIDALAKRGVRLKQFYVQPVCSPTRGALLTGRYPIRLGLQCGVVRPWAQHGLPLDERTLPQALREAGYQTFICGKWHLGHAKQEYLPTRRGFDHQYGHYNGALDYFTHLRDGGHDWHRDDRPNYDKGYTTELIGRAASKMIAEHDRGKPLFLYVPFNAPHTPLQAPGEYVERYKHMENKNRRTYAAMVACMDDVIGEIIDAAEEHLPRKNTLIFFCSDNGGIRRLGSNGAFRAGKGRLYEGGIRVPAIMAWDGTIEAGSVVDEPLHVVDLFPTILGLAGGQIEQDKPLDGKDAWPTIMGGKASPHEVILLNVTPFQGAIRKGEWKLVHNGNLGANAIKGPKKETWELFNLREDPSESRDLRGAHPEVFRELKQRLELYGQQAEPPHLLSNRKPKDFEVPRVWGHNG